MSAKERTCEGAGWLSKGGEAATENGSRRMVHGDPRPTHTPSREQLPLVSVFFTSLFFVLLDGSRRRRTSRWPAAGGGGRHVGRQKKEEDGTRRPAIRTFYDHESRNVCLCSVFYVIECCHPLECQREDVRRSGLNELEISSSTMTRGDPQAACTPSRERRASVFWPFLMYFSRPCYVMILVQYLHYMVRKSRMHSARRKSTVTG